MPKDKLGWMEPVYYGIDTETGEPIGVFDPEQWARIQAGYGCPRCWQKFSIVFTKCPVCQLDLTDTIDKHITDMPKDWEPDPNDPDFKRGTLKRGKA